MGTLNKYQNYKDYCIKELHSCMDYSTTKKDDRQQLLDIAREYCQVDIDHNAVKRALKDTEDHFNNEENDCTEDVETVYRNFLNNLPEESYEDHDIWKAAQKMIEGETCKSEESSESLEMETETTFEEGIIPSQFEPPVDPMTKQIISDPCRNKKCGHVYEYSSIITHLKNIKNNKAKMMCPYIGCTNKVMNENNIVRDKVLREQIRGHVADKSVRSEDDDNSIL